MGSILPPQKDASQRGNLEGGATTFHHRATTGPPQGKEEELKLWSQNHWKPLSNVTVSDCDLVHDTIGLEKTRYKPYLPAPGEWIPLYTRTGTTKVQAGSVPAHMNIDMGLGNKQKDPSIATNPRHWLCVFNTCLTWCETYGLDSRLWSINSAL